MRRSVEPTSWARFLQSEFARLPVRPPTDAELPREASYLVDRQLITATGGWGACVRPALTADGQDCVINHGGNASEHFVSKARSGNTYHHYENKFTDVNGNISLGSSNLTQTYTQTNTEGLDTRAILYFAGLVTQIAPALGLGSDEQATLTQQAGGLHDEASSPTPERGKLRRLFDQVLAGLTAASETAMPLS